MGEPDLSRLLLEASRVLGAEIVAGLQERGFPDARPGHAALFMHIDRRWGTRLSDLAQRARYIGIGAGAPRGEYGRRGSRAYRYDRRVGQMYAKLGELCSQASWRASRRQNDCRTPRRLPRIHNHLHALDAANLVSLAR